MTITILIPKESQALAQELTGTVDEEGTVTPSGLFTTPLTNGEEVTHYASSGNFLESELNTLLNADCPRVVHFGNPEDIFNQLGLSIYSEE
jgi:hypothetical protein